MGRNGPRDRCSRFEWVYRDPGVRPTEDAGEGIGQKPHEGERARNVWPPWSSWRPTCFGLRRLMPRCAARTESS
jgi:hypothetical protein